MKGFTEALIEDLRTNAPQVRVAVVMPGHVGTDIVANSMRAHGILPESGSLTDSQQERRAELIRRGALPEGASADEMREMLEKMNADFRDGAPLSAAGAATIILDGVRSGAWRILVGQDAESLDGPCAPSRKTPTTIPAGQHGGEEPPVGWAMAGLAETQVRRPEAADTVTGMQRAGMTTTPEPFPAR